MALEGQRPASPERASHSLAVVIVRGGQDALAARAEAGIGDTVVMALEDREQLARGRIPESARCNRRKPVTMCRPSGLKAAWRTQSPWPCSTAKSLPGGHLPETGRAILGGGDDLAAVGAERGTEDPVFVALENRQRPTVAGVPEADHAIHGGGHDDLAIGAERGGGHPVLVRQQCQRCLVPEHRMPKRGLCLRSGAAAFVRSAPPTPDASRSTDRLRGFASTRRAAPETACARRALRRPSAASASFSGCLCAGLAPCPQPAANAGGSLRGQGSPSFVRPIGVGGAGDQAAFGLERTPASTASYRIGRGVPSIWSSMTVCGRSEPGLARAHHRQKRTFCDRLLVLAQAPHRAARLRGSKVRAHTTQGVERVRGGVTIGHARCQMQRKQELEGWQGRGVDRARPSTNRIAVAASIGCPARCAGASIAWCSSSLSSSAGTTTCCAAKQLAKSGMPVGRREAVAPQGDDHRHAARRGRPPPPAPSR